MFTKFKYIHMSIYTYNYLLFDKDVISVKFH
jgi:hypothetical protein